jgi:ornithine cyclodeaminase/alanine dehydrogenase
MLFLSDADIEQILTMEETIDVVEKAFMEYANGNVVLPTRSSIMIPKYNGSISLMPSYLTELDTQATKIISIYPRNKEKGLPTTVAWIIVIDPRNGMVTAIMDASYLTAMRTGAITGVAAKYLAPKDAKTVAVFGAGVQGRTQVLAACVVREIEKVFVYDIDDAAKKRFAYNMSKELGIKVIPSETGKTACYDADIILTATTSSKPVIRREWLKDKVHVSAIGAFYPDYREIDTATIAEAKLVIDDLEGIKHEAGDIIIPISEGAISWEHIYAELKELVTGQKVGRTSEDNITVFKSVGIAIQDSSVAYLILNKIKQI